MKRDITKQPIWVQELIEEKEFQLRLMLNKVEELKNNLESAKFVNEVCATMDWTTVGIHTTERRSLFILDRDRAKEVCRIGEGYILIIGKPKK